MPVYTEPGVFPSFPTLSPAGMRLMVSAQALYDTEGELELTLAHRRTGGTWDGPGSTECHVVEDTGLILRGPCEASFTVPFAIEWDGNWLIRFDSDAEIQATRVRLVLTRCDWNGDGAHNSADFFDFLSDFFAGRGDFNRDGATNARDMDEFQECGR